MSGDKRMRDRSHFREVKEVQPDERFVMESLVAHFGGSWEAGEDPPDAYLQNSSGRIAVEVSTLTQNVEPPGRPSMPRIGQDAGVIDLVDALDESLRLKVKGDRYAILVLRSPLENLRKFKRELASRLELALAAADEVSESISIAGNAVKLSTHRGERPSGKRVVAVIPNRYSSADIAQNAAKILKDRIEDKALKMAEVTKSHSSWLALLNDYWLADPDTYRAAMRKLALEHPFEAIYLVGRQGGVDRLT